MPFKIMPIITIIMLSFVTQSYLHGQADTWQLFIEAVKRGDIAQTKYFLENKHLEKLKKEAKRELANSEKNVFNFKLDDIEQQIFDSTVDNFIFSEDAYNNTAITHAISNKDTDMLNLLLSYKPEIDEIDTDFRMAIYDDCIDIVKIFSEYLYSNSTLGTWEYSNLTLGTWEYYFPSNNLKAYSKYAKELGKSDIVKYFEDSGFFITEKDQQIGDLTEQKIDRYKKMFGTISQSDVDKTIHSYFYDKKLLSHENMLFNKSFILYLKKYTDINFTIHHIDSMIYSFTHNNDETLTDQLIFIMDTYNINADVPELTALSGPELEYNFTPVFGKLLNTLFERGFNPNLITLGERDVFFGYDTDFEKYIYGQQVAYNKKEQTIQKELKKAESKAKKATEKEEKRLAKEKKKLEKAKK